MEFIPKSYSIKLTPEQSDKLNSFLSKNNLDPSTFKEVFQLLLDEVTKPEFTEEILNAVEVYKTITEDSNPETSTTSIITKALTTPITKEIEVTKEITKDLGENEHIIKLDTEQINVLDEIAENRFKRAKSLRLRDNIVKESPISLLKFLAFHKATLNNYSGYCYTGRG